jgi:hypothetical protein
VKLRNEPKKGRFGAPLENAKTNPRPDLQRFDTWTIFIRAVAAGGLRGSDVMGNIGEIARRRDVTRL